MSFKEWYEDNHTTRMPALWRSDMDLATRAWGYQQARIEKLETAIRECMNREGFDDTQEAFDWWVEEHQPVDVRTRK